MDKFQNKYRIPSARAAWHDYNGGAYFITVCTKNREHFLGEIINGVNADCTDVPRCVSTGNTIKLSTVGQFLSDNLQNVQKHYPYAEIPLFVVMPNHWHAIVFIDGEKTPYSRGDTNTDGSRDAARHVSTMEYKAKKTRHISTMENKAEKTRHVSTVENKAEKMRAIANRQGWLSVTIGGIKSAVTKFANENNIRFAWQTRFHDRIIRDRDAMNRIANYIENNIANWTSDNFHSDDG